jgi:hypothetical protein
VAGAADGKGRHVDIAMAVESGPMGEDPVRERERLEWQTGSNSVVKKWSTVVKQ